jgi:hypothetical protein
LSDFDALLPSLIESVRAALEPNAFAWAGSHFAVAREARLTVERLDRRGELRDLVAEIGREDRFAPDLSRFEDEGEDPVTSLARAMVVAAITSYAVRRVDLRVDANALQATLAEVNEFHDNPQVTIGMSAPIHNASLVDECVRITDDLILSTMHSTERRFIEREGHRVIEPWEREQLLRCTHVLRATTNVMRTQAPPEEELTERLDDGLTVLRLLHEQHFTRTARWSRTEPQRVYADTVRGDLDSFSVAIRDVVPEDPYTLSTSEAQELANVYEGLTASKADRAVRFALRRFNDAYGRSRDDDRIVDFWIALEALFASDVNQEVRFRASLRIAAFLAHDRGERRKLFEVSKASYDDRSKIVHGSAVAGDLAAKAARAESLARRSLLKRLNHVEGDFIQALDALLLDSAGP